MERSDELGRIIPDPLKIKSVHGSRLKVDQQSILQETRKQFLG